MQERKRCPYLGGVLISGVFLECVCNFSHLSVYISGCTVQVLLGQRSFETLSQSQRQCLKQLLPSVDRDTTDRYTQTYLYVVMVVPLELPWNTQILSVEVP